MLAKIISWICSIFVIIFFIHAVFWSISRLLHVRKNHENKQHESLEYNIRYFYEDIDDIPTKEELEEDIQILNNIIEKLKNEHGNK